MRDSSAIKRDYSALYPHNPRYKTGSFSLISTVSAPFIAIERTISLNESGTCAVSPWWNQGLAQYSPPWNQCFIHYAYYSFLCMYMCILCNLLTMVVYPPTGLFLLGYSNHQKACACCTMAEQGASNVISALSMLKIVKQYGYSA